MTPIGAAKLASTLASKGDIKEQRIVVDDKEVQEPKKLDVNERHFQTVQDGMICSGNDTSLWVGYNVEEYMEVANKTGTAETGQFSDGEEIIHAWEISFAPTENPEVAVSVFLENGRSGWQAGYISREFYKFYYDKNLRALEESDEEESLE
jgi:cell division protein FtsI/penicillin-binding protein 2